MGRNETHSSWSVKGQGRDCFGLFGEDRIRIPKPTWRIWDREKTGTTGYDPGCVKTKLGAPAQRRFREIRYSGLLASPYTFHSRFSGAFGGNDGPYAAMAAVSGFAPRIFITRVKL
jgi:hypothetical protein